MSYCTMEQKLLTLFCIVTFAWSTVVQGSTVQVIYITPNMLKVPCSDLSQPCFTLPKFAKWLDETRNLSQSIEVVFLPGEHDLEYSVTVKGITDLSMHSRPAFQIPQITCRVNDTNFQFEHITRVRISGLKFVGCGNNLASSIISFTIEHTTFLGQNGSGTALELNHTNATMVYTTFDSNVIGTLANTDTQSNDYFYVGGAILAIHSNIKIEDSKFVRNHASGYGGAIFTLQQSNITLINANFTENSVCDEIKNSCFGGAIHISHENTLQTQHRSQHLTIINSTFSRNRAFNGAAFSADHTDVDIQFSHFDNNNSSQSISYEGGIMQLKVESHLTINGSTFSNNIGGITTAVMKSVTLVNSMFHNNKGYEGSALYSSSTGLITIRGCHFSNNSAIVGGALYVYQCNVTIDKCVFDHNFVTPVPNLPLEYDAHGGALTGTDSYITISKTNFTNNRADNGGAGALSIYTNVTLIIDTCTISNNSASLKGGAILAQQSTIIMFRGSNYITGNHVACIGGGMYTYLNVLLDVKGELIISNNTASDAGGGMFLYQSTLKCDRGCTIRYEHNEAVNDGGGIYAVSNTIISMLVDRAVLTGPSIHFIENNAMVGGGMRLALSAKIQITKIGGRFIQPQHSLNFTANTADYGAALSVYDDTYFENCLFSNSDCFLQVISTRYPSNHINGTDAVEFIGNNASIAGSVLYGGLLDRCAVSTLNEVFVANGGVKVDGITFFKNVSKMSGNEGSIIASGPVRVCLCENGHPDCTSTPPATIEVRKGENFTVALVAVDQAKQPLANSTIYAQLKWTDSGLGVGQLAQITSEVCSNLTFSIFSPYPSENLTLYADGPCRDTVKSVLNLEVVFKECTCPVGFHPRPLEIDNNCACDCDPQLLPKYITSCDPQTQILTRRGTSWISYLNNTNDTNQYSYLTYPYCPLDYCLPPDTNVEINLTIQDGSDVQCRNNRSGLLCGVCLSGLSVSLGTSRCISCDGSHDLWWLILVSITAGIALVAVLLALNMTVAVGTINGLIFYANIIGATSSTFFPTFSTEPAYVIIAWLNLDLGFDACFIDGMDTYMKTWIQMAFPTYIIFLLIIMIVWSEHSLRFARLIGRQNPVALLATLIFLSYAKFLSTVITALLFITLEYPDGSHKVVWLPDASVNYFSAKHLVLVVVAIIILLVGSVYTILLLFWQWIRKWAVGKISHKVCHFFDLYQAPYNLKHRYWAGLLLLARVTLYLLFALNKSGDPGVNLIGIIIVICSLLLLKVACGCVYKNQRIDILECTSYINITTFSAVQLYTLQSGKPQNISAFFSVSITAALLVMVVSYHIFSAVVMKLKHRLKIKHNQFGQVPQSRPQHNVMRPFHDFIEENSITTTVVEFPSTRYSDDEQSKADKQLSADNSESDDDDTHDSSKPLLS